MTPSHGSVPDGHASLQLETLLQLTASTVDGLDDSEAAQRLRYAPATIRRHRSTDAELLARQFRDPIVIMLVVAALLAEVVGEGVDALIITGIVLAAAVLGFFQERGAIRAVDALLTTVRVRARVLRSGRWCEVSVDDVVTGDIVDLRAGDVAPADARVLWSNALLMDESALTGESAPRHKTAGVVDTGAPTTEWWNSVWLGTHVASGEGRILVLRTGTDTAFGRISRHLADRHVPTAFERGAVRFGRLLVRTTAVLVITVLAATVALGRPVLEAVLFALALAVGLTPQMLPAIVTLSLSRGATVMAAERVVVQRLDAIEDIGGLDLLCTDKTGTLTVGQVEFERALDPDGEPDAEIAVAGWLTAHHQSGFPNPIDEALLRAPIAPSDAGIRRAEIPFDFERRILSVVVDRGGRRTLIAKGAVRELLTRCSTARGQPIAARVAQVEQLFGDLAAGGWRVLGVATRDLGPAGRADQVSTTELERELDFVGLLLFSDPPKPGARDAVERLRGLGVSLRLVTGDNRYAAGHIAAAMNLDTTSMLTGRDIAGLDDHRLAAAVVDVEVFAEVDPLTKERIVRALISGGHSVGFLGDGINDAPALHAADVGISVDSAVEVARQSADIVLLGKDLGVLADGVHAGRRVFANTLKYVHVTTSANFGNVVSMACMAVVSPFLPLLPTQILLLNFLSDVPAMTIATDRVDPESLDRPQRWDLGHIRRFMVWFGATSTLFDLLTFALLRWLVDAGPTLFRSAWFLESCVSEIAIMMSLRTQRPLLRSRPGGALAFASIAVFAVVVALPYSPLAGALGMTGPSWWLVLLLAAITLVYVGTTELLKRTVMRSMPAGADG